MKDSFWKGDGRVAWTAKVAVSSTGHAVARNYVVKPTKESDKANVLRPGDVGITLRIDRLVDGMTPEQRLAAQGLAEAMFKDLMKVLGKEVSDDEDFAAGSCLSITLAGHAPWVDPGIFKLVRQTMAGLHVLKLVKGLWEKQQSLIPWSKLEKADPIEPGDVKAHVVASLLKDAWPKRFRPEGQRCDEVYEMNLGQAAIERFSELWGEEYLVEFLLLTKVDYTVLETTLFRSRHNEDHVEQPWLKPALSLIKNDTNLQRIAAAAEHALVRDAAQKLLDERQAKAAG
jgi:hypothetical protein